MGYVIGQRATRETAVIRKMYYGPDGLQRLPVDGRAPLDEQGNEYPCITWGLRTLRGRDQRRMADDMVEMDTRKGTAKMRAGTNTRTRVMGSVVFVDGLDTPDGRQIEGLSEAVYEDLELWMINVVSEWIDELNQDSDQRKAKSLGE